MHPASRSLLARWIYAAKLASWPKLLVPMLLGQAIGVAAAGRIDTRALLLGGAFTIFDLLFIVFLNDWADRRVDRIKRQMFPDGSAKTIPDGILPASALASAGIMAGIAALVVAVFAGSVLARPGLGLAAAGLLGLFLAYSLPPIRLNYRGSGGAGERLEAFGVGVALPWFHVYLQAGVGWTAGLWLLPGFATLAFASAIASGLADEQSDRRGGKRTYASEYGNRAARALIERLVLGGCLVWAIGMRIAAVLPAPLGAIAVLVVLVNWRRLRKLSPDAKTNAFEMHTRYKHLLHNAIWRGATILALVLIAITLVGPGR